MSRARRRAGHEHVNATRRAARDRDEESRENHTIAIAARAAQWELANMKHRDMVRRLLEHPRLYPERRASLAETLAWLDGHKHRNLSPAGVAGLRAVERALSMVDAGIDPDPTKRRARRPAQQKRSRAELAPFLRDPSLLPKSPPRRPPVDE